MQPHMEKCSHLVILATDKLTLNMPNYTFRGKVLYINASVVEILHSKVLIDLSGADREDTEFGAESLSGTPGGHFYLIA